MKVKIHMHDTPYQQKPQKNEIKKISNTITENMVEISIEDLAREVGENGKTFTPAIFNGNRSKEKFVSQQVYCLDFDNGISIKEFRDRAEKYDIHPAVVYETFSSTEVYIKFRAIFINDCEIYNMEAAEILIKMLHEIFPECDKSCKDVSRMFFGGKALVCFNKDAIINLWDISSSLQAYLREKKPTNYARAISQIGKKINVAVKNHLLCIHRDVKKTENEDFCGFTSIIMVIPPKSSFFYIIEKWKEDKKSENHLQRRQQDERVYKTRIILDEIKNCALFKKFYKEDISHNLKFLLATNLLHIEGGEKLFFEGHINHVEKWRQDWRYLRKFQYQPQKCKNSGCPYYEQCKGVTMLDKVTSTIREKKIEDFVTIGESERALKEYMTDSVNATKKGIYLISAQTALGKTYTYCHIVENNYKNKPFMIVVPTTKLQKEVEKQLSDLGISVFSTPNINDLLAELHLDDLRDEVIFLYKRGFAFKVKSVIKKYMEEEELREWQYRRLEQYMEMKNGLDGETCVVTTHAMFLSLSEEILTQYEIIIDEDILMTIFKNTASISFEEVREAKESFAIPSKYLYRIEQLLQANDGEIKIVNSIELDKKQLEEIYCKDLMINSSLVDFLQADSYHVDVQNERIDFFNAKKIPDVKMTIVSATLDEELYRNYCRERNIYSMKVPVAWYKGTLRQYTAHSMSRSNIETIGYKTVMECVNNITKSKVKNVITFKKYSENSEIYYGKAEGYNEYKGKNLAAIGTPHNVPFVYRLIGAYLGYNANDKMSVRRTENDYYEFKFMTFKDPKMKNLQFFFIESELEQAIGRARLLRYDCTVYLFSNYPCRQAHIVQEEYLTDYINIEK